jgi:hypothetical protein
MHNKHWILRLLQGGIAAVLACAIALPAHAATFTDVASDDPYAAYIHMLASDGIASGMGDGTFGPDTTLTRAEFATFLVKAFQLKADGKPASFADIGQHWAAQSIQAAYEAGLVKGMSETSFAPNRPVKRQEAATVIWRYLKSQGFALRDQYQVLHPDDMPDEWAIEAVKNMTAYELHGPGGEVKYYPEGAKYRSKDDMLRKEMAALLYLAMMELKQKQESTPSETKVVKDYWGTRAEPKLPQRGIVIERYAGSAEPAMTVRIQDVLQPDPNGFLTKREDGVYKLANVPLLHMASDTLAAEQMERMTEESNDAAYLLAKLEFIASPTGMSYIVNLPAAADGFVWKRYDPVSRTAGIVSGETTVGQGFELYLEAGESMKHVSERIMVVVFLGEREDGLPEVQRIQAYAVNGS